MSILFASTHTNYSPIFDNQPTRRAKEGVIDLAKINISFKSVCSISNDHIRIIRFYK